MKQLITKGIILGRTDFGEADRIITMLTPEYGKLRLMAKGVRRVKSKLAGGIELFSISNITFIRGRGEMGTLVSSRLLSHYGEIVKSIDRVQLGYELIKVINKSTEDEPEAAYFDLLENAFTALNETAIGNNLIKTWFSAQLLKLAGHKPNLQTDASNNELISGNKYDFSFDAMSFRTTPHGHFGSDHIKLLRLIFGPNQPAVLQKVRGSEALIIDLQPLVQTMLTSHIRI